ncbi:MAG TPA: hypothetical protein VK506_06215 [Conexibacter sp.]|nr:hypothetical protein [Conexibacter sp.]
MSLVLLRQMRLLGVTGAGVRFVGELPFPHVENALDVCAQLDSDPSARSLRAWTARQRLGPWTTGADAWRRRLDEVHARLRAVTPEEGFTLCQGRVVVSARSRQLPTGPLDGAKGLELIFDDGSAVVAPVEVNDPPAFLLGSRLALLHLCERPEWWFISPSSSRVPVLLSDAVGVVVQSSPLNA